MATFLAIIRILPELVGLIKSLVASVERGIDIAVIKHKLSSLSEAIDEANKSKNTSRLERLFNAGSLHKRK